MPACVSALDDFLKLFSSESKNVLITVGYSVFYYSKVSWADPGWSSQDEDSAPHLPVSAATFYSTYEVAVSNCVYWTLLCRNNLAVSLRRDLLNLKHAINNICERVHPALSSLRDTGGSIHCIQYPFHFYTGRWVSVPMYSYILALCNLLLSIYSIMVRRQCMEIFIYLSAPYVEKSTKKKYIYGPHQCTSSEVHCNKTLRGIPPPWPDGAGVNGQGKGKYFPCYAGVNTYSNTELFRWFRNIPETCPILKNQNQCVGWDRTYFFGAVILSYTPRPW